VTTNPQAEWLETDGQWRICVRNGFRHYHGLLLTATKPPEGRLLMLAGLEVFVEIDGQRIGLSPQRYWQDVPAPPEPSLTKMDEIS